MAATNARFAAGGRVERRALWPARVTFALVPMFYVLYQFATNGREILSGGMWAELALTYYTAHDLPLPQQLLAGDAGYLPLPQRLMSLPLTLTGASAAAYPYYYFAVATVGAGLMVATLCLPTFRALIASDGLRFVVAIALLCVADVNTRAFTNFVYFAAVPLIAVTALALSGRRLTPAWAWVLPVFMISKLALLAIVPVMLLVAILRPGRFRAVALTSLVAAACQAVYVSQQPVSLIDRSAPDYLVHTLQLVPGYVLGFVGRWLVDPVTPRVGSAMAVVGACLLVAVVVLVVRTRFAALALVLVALAYAALNIVISTPVINASGIGSAVVTDPVPEMRDRLYIGAVLGVMLAVGGLVATATHVLADRLPDRSWARWIAPIAAVTLFIGWFALTGWESRARTVARQQGLPRMGTSQFERLAGVLDDPDARACVPVDGGWILGLGCTSLVGTPIPDPTDIVLHGFRTLPAGTRLAIPVPDQVRDGGLSSLAVMLQPTDRVLGPVGGHALVSLANGSTERWPVRMDVDGAGGLVQFSSPRFEPLAKVRKVEIRLDRSVDLAITTASWQLTEQVNVLWMGSTPEMLAAP